MNTTRTLTTFAAAIALASGIGFAYAQTTGGNTQAPAATDSTVTTPTPMQAPAPMQAPLPSSTSTPAADTGSATMPPATSTDSSAAPVERAPKADRG